MLAASVPNGLIRMPRRRLPSVFAVASLAVSAVLGGGYVASLSARVGRTTRTAAGEVGGRGVEVRLEEGRAVVVLESLQPTLIPLTRIGWHASGDVRPPRFDRPMRAVWEFDAHSLSPGTPLSVFLLAAPIWCLAVPCAIAPTLWLRARRRRRLTGRAGFTIVSSVAAIPSADRA